MLKRIRIEVEADSAQACVEELGKYEHVVQLAEAERYCLGYTDRDFADGITVRWAIPVADRTFYNGPLGRVVTEEVIEYVEGVGYKGRRVVQFQRVDLRVDRGGDPDAAQYLVRHADGTVESNL